ncbi:helix-turn-helix transcriptional regulator [Streptomyces sp. NPDC047002]|uniref:helix-turn-helix transcriptional regulator n=1 Tax=Streptomyces sp. NPDC047002 TaxID=3155475 RepID=UPI0034570210
MSDQPSPADGPAELRAFLRSRRARITPEQAGVPAGPGPRRVPGLRREEVAALAGVSTDYYVRLERGRNPHVSTAVLDAVARALRLDETEREHLAALARPRPARTRPLPVQKLAPGLGQVLDSVRDLPAMVTGRRQDILATNHLMRALYLDFDALPSRERNMARYVFLNPHARSLYADWEHAARGVVASLHLYAGRHPDDPRLAELIGELSLRNEDFRRWWAAHEVLRHAHGTKRYHHPVVGDLTLHYQALTPAADGEQVLGLYTAEPGSASDEALRLLASWAAPSPATDAPARRAGD